MSRGERCFSALYTEFVPRNKRATLAVEVRGGKSVAGAKSEII